MGRGRNPPFSITAIPPTLYRKGVSPIETVEGATPLTAKRGTASPLGVFSHKYDYQNT